MTAFTESVVEEAALEWLVGLGYEVKHGPAILAGEADAECADSSCRETILIQQELGV